MGGVEDNWVFKTEKTGVVVHHKKFHGDVSSCYRGSCVMPVSAAEVTKLYQYKIYVCSSIPLPLLRNSDTDGINM